MRTAARTETILLYVTETAERIEPRWIKRSRTGAHGEDCYLVDDVERAHAIVTIRISNSGRHYCRLELRGKLTEDGLVRLAVWLWQYEHICDRLAEDLVKYGLPAEVLTDLLQRNPQPRSSPTCSPTSTERGGEAKWRESGETAKTTTVESGL